MQWLSNAGSTIILHRSNQYSCQIIILNDIYLYSQIVRPGKLPSSNVCVNVPLFTPGHVPENDTVCLITHS